MGQFLISGISKNVVIFSRIRLLFTRTKSAILIVEAIKQENSEMMFALCYILSHFFTKRKMIVIFKNIYHPYAFQNIDQNWKK